MWIVAHWLHDGIIEIKDDYKEFEEIQSRPPANLWDVFRFSCVREEILPYMRRKIRKHKQELHCFMCTCKTAYINGYPQIKNNL